MPSVEFRGVSVVRAGGQRVLDRFDLIVETGEVFALVGRSGAGKTTLLKLVNRLLVLDAMRSSSKDAIPASGSPSLRAVSATCCRCGVVPAHDRRREHRRRAAARGLGADRTAAHRELGSHRLGRDQFAARWPDELSGAAPAGRRGPGSAVDPPILLMDDPFGALDPITRTELHAEFRRIQARLRKTVIMVTHDMREAFALADRIGVLDAGRLIACDPPQVLSGSADPRVRDLLTGAATPVSLPDPR
jgi:osmoprotectant transport system ATP-binding protein